MNPEHVTLTVSDHIYRRRVYARHRDFRESDARELRAVYRALGFCDECVSIVTHAGDTLAQNDNRTER